MRAQAFERGMYLVCDSCPAKQHHCLDLAMEANGNAREARCKYYRFHWRDYRQHIVVECDGERGP